MPRLKTQVLSLRTTEEVKNLLRASASKEHRSLSSMLEHVVYDYAERHALLTPVKSNETNPKKKAQ